MEIIIAEPLTKDKSKLKICLKEIIKSKKISKKNLAILTQNSL